jgi:hypothetical protein
MKTIKAVSIWDNGKVKEAKILNAYAVNVMLGTSAYFQYYLITKNEDLSAGQHIAQGNLTMTGEDYAAWEVDSYAWDWVASQLNLTIIGDYIAPILQPTEILNTELIETNQNQTQDESNA